MGSTFGGLNTLVRSIYTQQISLDTVSHNIANADTEGYSRQSVNMITSRPEVIYASNGQAQVGTGVEVQSITRARDTFVDQQMWKEGSSLGYGKTTVDTLSQIEGVFREPSATGLQSVFDKFWNSWQTLSTNAADSGSRTAVRQRGVEVVDAIQHSAQQLKDINNDINSVIAIKVDKVNQILSEVSSINKQVVNIEVGGSCANDLRDRRDVLVDQLSQMMNLRCNEDREGNYIIQSSGQVLVNGANYTKLEAKSKLDTAKTEENYGLEKTYLYVEGGTQALNFSNGEIKGLLDARDDGVIGVNAYLDKLNTMSKFFLQDFNEVHQTGYDLKNQQGGNFFGQDGVNYKTSWPPASAAPGAGTWLSQLTVNEKLFAQDGEGLIAAKNLAQITKSNGSSGGATVTGSYTATSNSEKLVVTITGVDGAGKVTSVGYASYNPPTSATATTTGTGTLQADGSFLLASGISIKVNSDAFNKANDTYTFTPVQGNAAGDNAVKLSQMLKTGMRAKEMFGSDHDSVLGNVSLDTFYSSMTGALGVQSQNAKRLETNQQALVKQVKNWRESVSGVNMDEEMTNMIRFQKGYNAAARMITTMDEMLDKLINNTGTVGR